MTRADRTEALMRLKINNAKKSDTFMNRAVTFVLWENGAERLIHLPHMKYFNFLSQ